MSILKKWTRFSIIMAVCAALLCGGAWAAVSEGGDSWDSYTDEDWEGDIEVDWDGDPDQGMAPMPKEYTTSRFSDVPDGADYLQAVETLADQGIFTGDEEGAFRPDATITRAETAALICRISGAEDSAKALRSAPFDDVPSSHWAVGYVAKAAELGTIKGYGNGLFGPEDTVTYEQIVKMLVCAWGYEDWAQEEGGWPSGYLSVAELLEIKVDVPTSSAAARSTVAQLVYQTIQAPNGNTGDVEE